MSDGKQEVKFCTPELISEREFSVWVGQIRTRRLTESEEAFYGAYFSGKLDDQGWKQYFDIREEEWKKPVHVRLIVQSIVVADKHVVPDFSTELAIWAGPFKIDSRFVSIRVKFPDDGDSAEGIVDLKRGTYIGISRNGKWIGFEQRKEEPVFY